MKFLPNNLTGMEHMCCSSLNMNCYGRFWMTLVSADIAMYSCVLTSNRGSIYDHRGKDDDVSFEADAIICYMF